MALEILHLESALEEALVAPPSKRSQSTSLAEFVKSLPRPGVVYSERVHSLRDVSLWLRACGKQNKQKRRVNGTWPTNVSVIHLSSHGTEDSLLLSDGRAAGVGQLRQAFSSLEGSRVKLVVLSSCYAGSSEALAGAILSNGSSVRCVVGYFNQAYDHTCLLAEQMLYYQLALHPKRKVSSVVRRVNDALWLMGEPESRMLSCWVREGDSVLGPGPWWKGAFSLEDMRARGSRSYLEELARLTPKKGPVGVDSLRDMRLLIRALARNT